MTSHNCPKVDTYVVWCALGDNSEFHAAYFASPRNAIIDFGLDSIITADNFEINLTSEEAQNFPTQQFFRNAAAYWANEIISVGADNNHVSQTYTAVLNPNAHAPESEPE